MDTDRLELLGQVASWYYEDNLGQSVIARRIGRSPSMVSRMLQEARDQGLVEISVKYPLKTDAELESQLCETFGLSEAWVLADPPNDHNALLRRLGRLGARCLERILRDGITIGVDWGTALYQVVRAMPNIPLNDVTVVQIMGAAGHEDPMVDGSELSRWLAQKLNATYRALPVPLIVQTETIARSLLDEPTIARTISLARQVDIALLGIGTMELNLSSMYRTGHLNTADHLELKQAGSVGYILCHQMDAYGRLLDIPLNRRVVSQRPDTLRSISNVIAVAGNVIKAPAILAALRGGYLNILVTDAITASSVLTGHAANSPVCASESEVTQ